jgi:hypothetical protein
MIGYTPAEQAIRAALGYTPATGADDPPAWHDHPGAQPDDQAGDAQ